MQKYLETKHQTLSYATSRCTLNAEIDAITAAIGGMIARLELYYKFLLCCQMISVLSNRIASKARRSLFRLNADIVRCVREVPVLVG